MTLACWPNLRNANGSNTSPHERWAHIDEHEFITPDLRVLGWADEPDACLHGYWGFDWPEGFDWPDTHIPVKSGL